MAVKHFCDRCGNEVILPKDVTVMPHSGNAYVMQSGVFQITVTAKKVDYVPAEGEKPRLAQAYVAAELCCDCIAVISKRGESPKAEDAE